MEDDVAGIHSDAQSDFAISLAIQFNDTGPYGDRGAAGLHGMVFSGDRGPEQSHDAITAGLVHEAIMLMNCVHQNLKHRPKYFKSLFRIKLVDQWRRPANIGEQDRDMLAFAGHGAAGMQCPLEQLGRYL